MTKVNTNPSFKLKISFSIQDLAKMPKKCFETCSFLWFSPTWISHLRRDYPNLDHLMHHIRRYHYFQKYQKEQLHDVFHGHFDKDNCGITLWMNHLIKCSKMHQELKIKGQSFLHQPHI